ncbi:MULTISPECIES: DUF6378 domain-containing protein [unclassified Aurantimonas]|uniref:DUF6378 domain-containing protein n=1 Tax=unclassified Aurantimonas TaxID=2638230 RepID=UPI002E1959B5|nr:MULTISPECIES: DUF6378 domain-containing protein [unclassified Aurantimonas]MEC5291548.1 DUF6378 domain-containing protein [Aurantimonas sp. C2-3-R2]MEC5412632.1 DUF6378 domain-containing protein [Aurantimonas sp. C2-4-R8]
MTTPTVTKASLLDAAKAAVADRGLNYGKPEDNFRRIAELWSTHIKNRYAQTTNDYGNDMSTWDGMLDPSDVALMMVLMKIARLENEPTHQDSIVDMAGYAACLGEIADGIKKDA